MPDDNSHKLNERPVRPSTMGTIVRVILIQVLMVLFALIAGWVMMVAESYIAPMATMAASMILLVIVLLDVGLTGVTVMQSISTHYIFRPGEVAVLRDMVGGREEKMYPASSAVEIRQGPLGKQFNYGTIRFQSPGRRIMLIDVPDPKTHANIIKQRPHKAS